MSKQTATLWGATTKWYDQRGSSPPILENTKQRAINEIKGYFGDSWPKAQREGWYVAKVTLTWDAPQGGGQ